MFVGCFPLINKLNILSLAETLAHAIPITLIITIVFVKIRCGLPCHAFVLCFL
jgi:hypothetical protein